MAKAKLAKEILLGLYRRGCPQQCHQHVVNGGETHCNANQMIDGVCSFSCVCVVLFPGYLVRRLVSQSYTARVVALQSFLNNKSQRPIDDTLSH